MRPWSELSAQDQADALAEAGWAGDAVRDDDFEAARRMEETIMEIRALWADDPRSQCFAQRSRDCPGCRYRAMANESRVLAERCAHHAQRVRERSDAMTMPGITAPQESIDAFNRSVGAVERNAE